VRIPGGLRNQSSLRDRYCLMDRRVEPHKRVQKGPKTRGACWDFEKISAGNIGGKGTLVFRGNDFGTIYGWSSKVSWVAADMKARYRDKLNSSDEWGVTEFPGRNNDQQLKRRLVQFKLGPGKSGARGGDIGRCPLDRRQG